MEYVDVREAWPIYYNGMVSVVLPNMPHSISVEDARQAAKDLLAKQAA